MLLTPQIDRMAKVYYKILLTFCLVLFLTLGILKGCNDSKNGRAEIYPPKYSHTALYKPSGRDSFIVVPASKQYIKGPLHTFFFGSHYRELWATPVRSKVLDISTEKGGLTILKKGGNMQTLSLRLETPSKRRYVIRSIDKDQSKALPEKLKKTFVKNIFRDQTSALNPFGALIIPSLANAAGILHTNPELFVVPYDSALKEYKDEFSGAMVIMEEYPDDSWVGTPTFWNADEIAESEDFIKARFKSSKNKADIRLYARSRLFDAWINDWDRHTGQWKWAVFKSGQNKIYKPIPRDRDMSFYKFDDGLLNKIALLINNKFQSFNSKFDDAEGLLKNAWYFDKLLLPQLTVKDWTEIADSLTMSLNDQVIEEACKKMPAQAYQLIGKSLITKLKSRRAQLHELSIEYYKILNENVTIVGTDNSDRFDITRNDIGVNVKMSSNGEVVFDKLFALKSTSEISFFTLKGNDTIIVNGNVKRSASLNIYSGEGIDLVEENSNVESWGRSTSIFDTPQNNNIKFGKEGRDKTSPEAPLDFDRVGVRKKE